MWANNAKRQWVVAVLLAALLVPSGAIAVTARPLESSSNMPQETRAAYGALPLVFESNEGQGDSATRFVAHGKGYALALAPTEALLSLTPPIVATSLHDRPAGNPPSPPPASTVHFRFPGANPDAAMRAEQPLPGIVNYLVGNDPEQWRTNIPTTARVRYTDLYPGIDLVVYGTQDGAWEYDVIVAPGADPATFALAVEGTTGVTLDAATGDLVLGAGAGEVRQHAPTIYQTVNGERRGVTGGYALREDETVGFAVGEYDPTVPLVIDPTLVYSAYLGGSGLDQGFGIAVDTSGNAYITGTTTSADFPGTPPMTYGGGIDAFVTKLSTNGTLIYSTYLSGSGSDRGIAIAVDTSGNAYVTGNTDSTDFPAPSIVPRSGGVDAFVVKLSTTGGRLYGTYLGGSADDYGRGIAVDTAGNAYVTGETSSPDFPVTNGTMYANGPEAFATKLSANGVRVYSTYLGGSSASGGNGIAVDTGGNAYVTGVTFGVFPVTDGSTYSSGVDAFVAKLNGSGALVYGTYLGGCGYDQANGIAVDAGGNAYVTGATFSADFPVTNRSTIGGNGGATDAFVTKLNGSGARVYSSYLGGSNTDMGNGIAVDAGGNAYVTGATFSADFPVTDGSTLGGPSDAFVTKFDGSGARVYGAYLGGSAADEGDAIAVDTSGRAYITGKTAVFPVTPGSAALRGAYDAFVTEIVVAPPIVLSPAMLANGALGTSYSQTITASGGTAPYTFAVTSGALPPGLTLATNGALSGKPTGTGSFMFTITATDHAGATGSRAYTLVVTAAPNPLPSPRPGGGTGGGPPRSLPPSRPGGSGGGIPKPVPLPRP